MSSELKANKDCAMTTKQNPKDMKDTVTCVYMNGNSKTALEFNTYSFFCFSFVGSNTASVTHPDTFRDNFELTQKIPMPTIHASTVHDVLLSAWTFLWTTPGLGFPHCGHSRCLSDEDPTVFALHTLVTKQYFSRQLSQSPRDKQWCLMLTLSCTAAPGVPGCLLP